MNNMIIKKAYGKINLALDIIGRRPDGYHEVSMIMQSVSIADELVFEKTDEAGLKLRFGNLPCEEGAALPSGSDNIIFKAYKALNERYHLGGVECTLTKNIPIAAGMAGGSTDAAATLKGLCELFALDVSDSELAQIAVGIGADVPYCLMGGTALSEGIGERLTKLPSIPGCSILLVHPEISVSTKEVYNAYDSALHTFHPDIPAIRACIGNGDLKGMCELAGNVLEEATIPMHPEIRDIKNKIREFEPLCSLMTGSGPTVFGIFDDEKKAKEALKYFKASSFANGTYTVTCV